jgi:hypothetical protein
MKKSDMADMLRDLPEELDAEELIYRFYLKEKIDVAEAAARNGDTLTHEEALRLAESWRK